MSSFDYFCIFSVGLILSFPKENVGNGNMGGGGAASLASGLTHLLIYSTHVYQMPALCQRWYWFLGIWAGM